MLARVRRFWQGEERLLVSLFPAKLGYSQVVDDAAILQHARTSLPCLAQLPGVNLPSFSANFGTISTAKYWGGTPRFDSTGGNIYLPPVANTLDEAIKLEPLPVGDDAMDGAHGLRLYRELCAELETDALWMRTPDFQGTLTTAVQVLEQQELLMALYCEPEQAHRFLDRVCSFLIDYGEYLKRETGNRICGNIWPDTFLPCDLGMSFTEDLMPLLSVELYREFGIPYLRRMERAFGGLHIHCCGDWGRHAPTLRDAELQILAMEFHYPHTRIDEIACLEHTVFIPYILLDQQTQFNDQYAYFRYLIEETDTRIRYWFVIPGDDEAALQFAREFGGDSAAGSG